MLQDLVNEIGRRLDYRVENGLYSGKQNEIGNGGLWKSPEGSYLIVEVKTTDAYRISLDTIAGYRHAHISNRSINDRSSILIVVGRQDTGELEAQVRGSRHAWDVRLISAEALVKLALLKERSEKAETGSQIRSILVPVEYTRVDALVDVVFTAARDVEEAGVEPEKIEKYLDQSDIQSGNPQYSKREIQERRERIVERFSQIKRTHFIKKSRAILRSPDGEIAIACTVSKRYERGNPYWYAYHPAWRDFLNTSGEGFFILGCMDKDEFFAIPSREMEKILSQLHTTETDKQMYWHIQLREGRSRSLELVVPQGDSLQLDKYAFSLGK